MVAAVAGLDLAGLDAVRLGSGDPVTLLVHGLAGTVADVMPLAAALPGTRWLPHLSGHGDSPPLRARWDFPGYAAEIDAAAAGAGATRVVGMSVAAGAVLHLLAAEPHRFARAVLLLPPALDRPAAPGGTRALLELGAVIESGDVPALVATLLAGLPPAVRDTRVAAAWARARATGLAGRPAPWGRVGTVPVTDATDLAAVSTPCLVVGQPDDLVHPLSVAREVARRLPAGRLLELPAGQTVWTARRALAGEVARFLADGP